jgi:methylated-DNA-[protein]-cysteine S-methyltransferase
MLEAITILSPIGNLEVQASDLGLRSIRKVNTPLPASKIPISPFLAAAKEQINEYFAGKRTDFELHLDWSGHPEFSVQVWQALLLIPFGETATYSDIAQKIASPKAVRAVGMANRNNPFAIVVPCHRVIGKSGHLTGYFYGVETKMQLLRHENPARYPLQMVLEL